MADYPFPTFHFQVSWGPAKMAFTEASGMKIEADIIEYRDGANPEFSSTKMPGLRKYGDITLKRGIFKSDEEFFKWWKTVAKVGKVERRDIVISLLDEEHQPVVNWKISKAWPSHIEGPNLNSSGKEVAIESLTIVNEGIEIEYK